MESRKGNKVLRRYAIKADSAVVGDSLDVVRNATIVVEDGLIVAISENPDAASGIPVAEVHDHLIPGFVNAHTHLGDAALAEMHKTVGEDENLLYQPDGLRHQALERMDQEFQERTMRNVLVDMVSKGVVAVADFREGGVAGVESLARARAGLPIRCMIFGRVDRFPIMTADELERNTGRLPDSAAAEVADVLRVADGFSLVSANDLTDAAIVDLRRQVRDQGKMLAAHACVLERDRDTSLRRTGQGDVARAVTFLEPDFLVHLTAAGAEEFRRLESSNTPIVMCGCSMATLGYGLPPFDRARAAGVVVALGTDNAMLASPGMLSELHYFSHALSAARRQRYPVTSRDLLWSATMGGARALGIDAELGSLAVGKEATFVTLDGGSENLRNSQDLLASIVARVTERDIVRVHIRGREVHTRAGTDELWAR